MPASILRRNTYYGVDSVAARMLDWLSTPVGMTPMARLFTEGDRVLPPVDIYETAEEIIVAAGLPNLNAEQVNIQVLEDQLTVSGEQRPLLSFEPEENAVQHLNGVTHYGKFSFSFHLPKPVDPQQTQARYDNGVLHMRFLKARSARPIRIKIHTDARPQIAEAAPTETGAPVSEN